MKTIMDYLKCFLKYKKCPQLLTGIYVACELLSTVMIRKLKQEKKSSV